MLTIEEEDRIQTSLSSLRDADARLLKEISGLKKKVDALERFGVPEKPEAEDVPRNEEYWRKRCELAENFIDLCPADLDPSREQMRAYRMWQAWKKTQQAGISK